MKKKLISSLALMTAVSTVVTACGSAPAGTSVGALDDKTVIAKLADESKADKPEDFNITLGDFNKEYKFYLSYYDVDETDEANAESCEQKRRELIEYLVLEKVSLYKAAEAGITAATLTDAEFESLNAGYDEALAGYKSSYEQDAIALLPEGYTEEQLDAKETELLNEFLTDCGYTTDIFFEWAKIDLIQSKFGEKMINDVDVTVTDEEVNEYVKGIQDEAKTAYESDVSKYESTSGYLAVYVPEGARNIRHIYFAFDTSAVNNIQTLRSSGDTEGADAARDTAYENIRKRAEAALAMLDGGELFDVVQAEYNDDTSGAVDYMLVPETVSWAGKYADSAFAIEKIGDYSGIVVTDSGAYIQSYYSNASVSEETVASFKDYVKSSLLSQKQTDAANDLITEWLEYYAFDIDYDKLNITIEDDAESLDTTTAAESPATTAAETSASA